MHTYTNRLVHETSPYLLQHAHNPVDWYPWGDEALSEAKLKDKPVLVSIGYSACHWCHVMERESFENEETARMMNELFINIKIDREERPDIDHILMDAVQAMTGSGGWPLNVFLLPGGKPFYGGTYFPPQRAFNRNSWTDTLLAVSDAYCNKKEELENQAENLTAHLVSANSFGNAMQPHGDFFNENTLAGITNILLKNADKVWGGFGAAPKFPQTFAIQYLLRDFYHTKNAESLHQALLSLDKMIQGGIYDQLGGGFARYSTDEKWLAPHFEKMLYDNALLLNVLAEAYQVTGIAMYKIVIAQTMDFLQREMMNADGVFYSALDADSEGVEGKFYTWNRHEIQEILQQDATLFCEFYNVVDNGNWEHTNILWVRVLPAAFCLQKGLDTGLFEKKMKECRQKLLERRNKKIRPQTDDKILLGCNALMNIACSKVFAATGDEGYRHLAESNMHTLEKIFAGGADKLWMHTYKNGIAKYAAFLDDYAYLIQAYIYLQEITGNADYAVKARQMAELVQENFRDNKSSYFFYTGKSQADAIVRKKDVYDGAIPSGNAVMAGNLYYLSVIFDKSDWQEQARDMLVHISNAIIKYPSSFGNWSCLLQNFIYGTPQIVATGYAVEDILPELLKQYIPGRILQVANHLNDIFPLLAGKDFDSDCLIYVCEGYVCKQPVKFVKEIKNLLK